MYINTLKMISSNVDNESRKKGVFQKGSASRIPQNLLCPNSSFQKIKYMNNVHEPCNKLAA